MFETIKRLYKKTGNVEVVKKSVVKGWITESEFKEITGNDY